MVKFFLGLPLCVASAFAIQKTGHVAARLDRSELAFNPSEFASELSFNQSESAFDFHKAEGNSILKETRAREDVDAWLVVHTHNDDEVGVYTPLIETVKEAVESKGSVVQTIGTSFMKAMIAGVRAAVAKGRRPLVFTLGHDWVPRTRINFVFSQLRTAKEAGEYLVQYNSEVAGNHLDRYGVYQEGANQFQGDGVLRHLAEKLEWAEQMGADELWDWTPVHVQHYPRQTNGPIIRYVPPGYTRKLDQGVDLHSASAQIAVLGYLGSTPFKTCAKDYKRLVGCRLHEEHGVGTLDDLKNYMERYPMQLSQHRSQTCLPRQAWEDEYQHFEAFRMAVLLTNKACVISAPSARSEIEIWKHMVTFVEVEDTVATMERLAKNLDQCRNNAYETYKREFAAPTLLERSKFFQTWRPPHGI